MHYDEILCVDSPHKGPVMSCFRDKQVAKHSAWTMNWTNKTLSGEMEHVNLAATYTGTLSFYASLNNIWEDWVPGAPFTNMD